MNILISNIILNFLNKNLGKSGRGFTTGEIKKFCKINLQKSKLSKILQKLENEHELCYTGNTKGKRYVASHFSESAKINFDRETIIYRMKWEVKYTKKNILNKDNFRCHTLSIKSFLDFKNDWKIRENQFPRDELVFWYILQIQKISIEDFLLKLKIIKPIQRKRNQNAKA